MHPGAAVPHASQRASAILPRMTLDDY